MLEWGFDKCQRVEHSCLVFVHTATLKLLDQLHTAQAHLDCNDGKSISFAGCFSQEWCVITPCCVAPMERPRAHDQAVVAGVG
eukprot:976030-Amphidinium_carterae.1